MREDRVIYCWLVFLYAHINAMATSSSIVVEVL